jgi:hypothetical protein
MHLALATSATALAAAKARRSRRGVCTAPAARLRFMGVFGPTNNVLVLDWFGRVDTILGL